MTIILDFSDLAGRSALVTGASSGIGLRTATVLGSLGMRVHCIDLNAPEATAAAIRAEGGEAIASSTDIADDNAVAAAIARTIVEHDRLDVAVNCAGIGDFTSLEQSTPEHWEKQLRVNLTGPFYLLRHAVPAMREQGSGSIVLFGSIAGKTGGLKNGPSYAAAKAGVHGLIKWAAKANASAGVRVNGIAPGPVDTPFTQGQGFDPTTVPLGRMGDPLDFASAVAFLASDMSGWTTGQVLNINGGLFME